MRAAIVPSTNSAWVLQEVPTPEPGPNQILIKIRASGMCYTDVHQTRGEIPGPFPRTLGHEPVGEIVAVGVGVTARKVGDRVGVPGVQSSCGRCEWCLRGKPMFCAGYTVWSGLRWAAPQPGERVAVVGIGGLGHLAVQYGKAAGFHTVAVSHSPDKDRLIRDLGADEVVRDGAGLAGAGGADIVLGTSNSMDATADSIRGLRPDGRLVLMGAEAKPLAVSPLELIMKRIKIIGSQQNGREYLHEALALAASGKVRVVTETYRLDEIGKAYERVAKGRVRFRAAVMM